MNERQRRKLTKKQMEEALKTVKIVDKEEAFWIDAQNRATQQIEALEKELKIARVLLSGCDFELAKIRVKNGQPIEEPKSDSS